MRDAATRLYHAPPSALAMLLTRRRLGHLTLGDVALEPALALDAVALYAAERTIDDMMFWGRRAAFHLDRFRELMSQHGVAPPRAHAVVRFEPIDFLDAADHVTTRCAALEVESVALLDAEAVLEGGLLREIASLHPLAPLSTHTETAPT